MNRGKYETFERRIRTKNESENSTFRPSGGVRDEKPATSQQGELKSPPNEETNSGSGRLPEFKKRHEYGSEDPTALIPNRKPSVLEKDRWSKNIGHRLTFIGLFLFTSVLYFRPYELIPALAEFNSMAWVLAFFTLLVFLPTQFYLEGNLTGRTTEIWCLIGIALYALVTIPIAKDSALAWETFNDSFSKIVIIFIVAVNVLTSKVRLTSLMWLSIGIAVYLSCQALVLNQNGVFKTEGYRVHVDFGGMFRNPNDMAIHLVIFTPVAICLGIAAKGSLSRLIYFVSAGLMVAGNMVTQSRGGFLGLITVASILVWKLGKRARFKTIVISTVTATALMILAPGNYANRILSIFIPSLDPVGSSDERRELLIRSLQVTLRNPLGIGIGNFPIVGIQNKVTHNAFTQVSSELGLFSFALYLIFLISPWLKLGLIEDRTAGDPGNRWIHFLAIGLQASIAGYMVASFFGSVAYQWYIYYPIAYAVCLRRLYVTTQEAMVEASPIGSTGFPALDIGRVNA